MCQFQLKVLFHLAEEIKWYWQRKKNWLLIYNRIRFAAANQQQSS